MPGNNFPKMNYLKMPQTDLPKKNSKTFIERCRLESKANLLESICHVSPLTSPLSARWLGRRGTHHLVGAGFRYIRTIIGSYMYEFVSRGTSGVISWLTSTAATRTPSSSSTDW